MIQRNEYSLAGIARPFSQAHVEGGGSHGEWIDWEVTCKEVRSAQTDLHAAQSRQAAGKTVTESTANTKAKEAPSTRTTDAWRA